MKHWNLRILFRIQWINSLCV